jgi:multidrug efflux pump subunit AcrA (membrane-fusion protein)
MVKVRFLGSDKRILPEMSAKVAFLERAVLPGEDRARVALLPASIATRDGQSFVFVIAGEKVVQTAVKLGPRLGDMVEVLSGVKAGERIAVTKLEKLHDKSRVKMADKLPWGEPLRRWSSLPTSPRAIYVAASRYRSSPGSILTLLAANSWR